MGTDTGWGGKPATDWHPVQKNKDTPCHIVLQKLEVNSGHNGHNA